VSLHNDCFFMSRNRLVASHWMELIGRHRDIGLVIHDAENFIKVMLGHHR
jgi:hypothetical protein